MNQPSTARDTKPRTRKTFRKNGRPRKHSKVPQLQGDHTATVIAACKACIAACNGDLECVRRKCGGCKNEAKS